MSDPTGGSGGQEDSGLRTAGGWLREIAIVVIGALIASTLLRLFIVQMFVIPSGSMEDTLQVRDRVAVQKLAQFQRGDIVVFRDTQGWLGPAKQEVLRCARSPHGQRHCPERVGLSLHRRRHGQAG
mgnify:CR=1 FL=1